MRFKIVSTGWNCYEFLKQTLESVERQTVEDWDIWIVDDASTDLRQPEFIQDWCADRDERWNYTLNTEQKFVVRNQVETIRLLKPEPEDVIVFLDLDGDRFAHNKVLARLVKHYDDDVLLTYGSYRPVPDHGNPTNLSRFPSRVERDRSYRAHCLRGGICFNHLRTMRGMIFNNIPETQFKWKNGKWYKSGTDYIFMCSALELANGRYKYISEILLLYNDANPYADNKTHPKETSACVVDFLRRRPLSPLEMPDGLVFAR